MLSKSSSSGIALRERSNSICFSFNWSISSGVISANCSVFDFGSTSAVVPVLEISGLMCDRGICEPVSGDIFG